ncbi:SPOR domain-containing protein [Caminibacter mediatlanticus]|uniref:SPOR domain-containing protein n=1 Tax=Caminibacter mediatlanticus TB-2 TaxID=391592 RepID=A0AAI9AI92_9BACT|nr:SPOR domain-containing protein [Caminibacter mediatlanticus]EDM24158.1 hypothetical protein CMTB2_01543 [Caminibacter mediatlanticus TB-2]
MKNDDLLNLKPKRDLKKPLIYGAIGFLIFIIIVIIVAIFQNSSTKNSNEIIPPEQPKENIKVEKQFQTLPVEEANNSIKIEEQPKKLPNKKEENLIQNTVKNPPITKETNTTKKNKDEKIIINKKPIEKVKVASQKFKPKKETAKKIGNYYIQVAALLKNAKPNPKFLEIIKKQGFNYKFYHTTINKNGNNIKVTKILIGPFKYKKEAKKALNKVKAKITQNAFIFKVKNGL